MKQKIISIFISLIGFIACFPPLLPAWFSAAREVTQPFYDHNSGVSAEPALFYLYDNVVSGQESLISPYLMPSTRNFVPADRININMPLQIIYERSVSSGESLDALLNANLSLQLLMEQYKELQKRTAELFKSLNIPYLEGLKDKTIENMNISFNKVESGTKLYAQDSDIRLQAAELSNQISETVRNKPVGTFYLSDKEIPSFAGLKVEGEGVEMSSGKKVFSVADTGFEIRSNSAVQLASGGDAGVPGASDGVDFQNNGYDRAAGTGKVGVNAPSTQSELPWIFKAILITIAYIASNKIESSFYGAILFFIFYFIYIKTSE